MNSLGLRCVDPAHIPGSESHQEMVTMVSADPGDVMPNHRVTVLAACPVTSSYQNHAGVQGNAADQSEIENGGVLIIPRPKSSKGRAIPADAIKPQSAGWG